jgi:hypothetical protein
MEGITKFKISEMQPNLFEDKVDFLPSCSKHRDCLHELQQHEIWVGNTDVRSELSIPSYLEGKVKTARLGEQAYDIHGKPIERWYMRPLIIHQSESGVYDRIMMDRLKSLR